MQKTADKLGSIVMIELRDALAVPLSELTDLWGELGLPLKYLPKKRNAKDAFRKATPRSKRINGLQLEPYKGPALDYYGLEMAVVMTRIQDAESEVAKRHENCIVVGLDKYDQLQVQAPRGISPDEARYLDQIRKVFDDGINEILDGNLVRSAVKRVAEDANAFTIKGGVFMFPETGAATGESLVRLAERLNPFVPKGGEPNSTLIVTYHDDPLQRDQLKAKLNLYVKETLQHELAMIQSYAARTQKPVGNRKKESVMGCLTQLGHMIAEYESVLGETMQELATFMAQQRALFQAELNRL